MTPDSGVPTEIMTRIAKLLAKAKSLEGMGNIEEAALFSEKVSELLLEHKLSMSDVELKAQDEDDPINRTMINPAKAGYEAKKQRIAWQEDLASTVAAHNFCRVLVHMGSNYVTFVGRNSDRQVATYLFSVLAREISQMVIKEYAISWRRESKEGDVTRLRGFKSGFYAGAVDAISSRLYEKRRSVMSTQDTRSTAIVVAADAAVQEWMDAKLGNRKTVNSPKQKMGNWGGYARGKEFGNSVNLDPRAVLSTGGSAKQLPASN